MTSSGEEATAVGSAAALSIDDVIFAQYREQGALMWRGFTVQDMADQVCFSDFVDYEAMPVKTILLFNN